MGKKNAFTPPNDEEILEILDLLNDSDFSELRLEMEEGAHYQLIAQLVKRAQFPDASVSTIDGLRVDFDDGFGLVRASNTTPMLILRFEADDQPALERIQNRFRDPDELRALGDIQIKISGCMNACGHHHIGHIGILGVDKRGEEWFQITLGGRADRSLKIGERLGPAVDRNSIASAVESIVRHYLRSRIDQGEHFLGTLNRIGIDSFKEVVYG